MSKEEFDKALDAACIKELAEERRTHLGASVIGVQCAREVWYGFRWAAQEELDGRRKRLLNRGHEEEHRVARWLRAMGCELRQYAQRLVYHPESDSYVFYDWDEEFPGECHDAHEDRIAHLIAEARGLEVRQWGFKEGHFGGSSDGKIYGVHKWYPELEGLGFGTWECKTVGLKYMSGLKAKGVQVEKYEHYVQAQTYMHRLGAKWCLYTAACKDNDEIYHEVLHYWSEVAEAYGSRAEQLVEARTAPPKVSKDPSWFACKFCDFKRICHHNEQPDKNCRSCVFAIAAPDGTWQCGMNGNATIPGHFIPKGCNSWEPIK